MIVFCYCGAQEHATIANDSLQKKNEKDIVDVYRHLFSKKTKRDTIAIKKVAWTAIPAAGYTMQTGFAGVISAKNNRNNPELNLVAVIKEIKNETFLVRFSLNGIDKSLAFKSYIIIEDDVIYRYSLRQGIEDRIIKNIEYIQKDDSGSDNEKFQKIY